jgi:acyl-CoA synthetase (AMP-forming)/AMP-acid ligase II
MDEGLVSGGGVCITDCIGSAINVAGRKVSPTRLQNILEQIDGVVTAVVERGQSHDYERYGEIRVRLIIKRGYAPKIIREQLRQRVESWEMPRHWEFLTSEGDFISRQA